MKNINENELRNYIFKKLQESYFDELEFDDEAMRAAMSDIEADPTAGTFTPLGSSKFEKGSDFEKNLKSSLKQANLELPSDEAEVKHYAQLLKKRKAQEDRFGVGSLNETEVEHIKDADGKSIKLKSSVQHKSGVNGVVERFMVGDDKNMLVKVNWIQDSSAKKLKSVVSPEEIIVKENTMMNEEAYEASRYMFFGNLQQIRRQAGLLLDLDEDKIQEILENGHDWAQDHIATAKESIDQVFDFLMNETSSGDMWKSVDLEDREDEEESSEDIEEGMGHSFTVGMNKNEKPVNYPEELMRESFIKEDEYVKLSLADKIKLWAKGISEEKALENLNAGIPMDWPGSVEGYYATYESSSDYSGTNEGLKEYIDKTDYYFNQDMLNYEREEDFNKEVYYIIDNEFNQTNYPDLVGKIFDTPPSDADFEVVKQGEVDESSSDSLANKHGQNAKPHEMEESSSNSLINKKGKNAKPNVAYLKEGYEDVIQLQDNQANYVFTLLKQDGPDEAIEYLKEWHKPGTHRILSEVKKGALDKSFEKDGYTMTWNPSIGYVKLSYNTKKQTY